MKLPAAHLIDASRAGHHYIQLKLNEVFVGPSKFETDFEDNMHGDSRSIKNENAES
eukprot:SAG31_NODE_2676_length_5264_cov_576.907278_4_plen_56_part_00